MIKSSIIFLIITVFMLTSCATGYHRSRFNGGYSEMALSQDTYMVSFRGNGFTSYDTVQRYLLRRCAELTLEKGYKFFVVLTGNTSDRSSIIQTPTTASMNTYGSYGYGNYYSTSSAVINPGVRYRVHKYGSQIIIKMFKSNKNVPLALDAKIILTNFIN